MKNSTGLDILEGASTDHKNETLHWLPLNNLYGIKFVYSFLKTKNLNNLSTAEHIISRE